MDVGDVLLSVLLAGKIFCRFGRRVDWLTLRCLQLKNEEMRCMNDFPIFISTGRTLTGDSICFRCRFFALPPILESYLVGRLCDDEREPCLMT